MPAAGLPLPPPVRLIVNADDFGLTEGINRAIIELHRAGAISSATLMANGRAFTHAATTAKDHPTLGIGCHVVLVDGTPVAPPQRIPTLLGKDGQLRSSLVHFAMDLHRGQIAESDIEAEATAQIHRLQATGLNITHVDTHKHTHLFPQVARPLLRAAQACGIHAVRNPFEESWSARLARGALVRRLEVSLLRNFRTGFASIAADLATSTTNGSIGVSATGRLDAPILRDLLHAAPPGIWELVCHPGYNDAALGTICTHLRETRETERLALLQEITAAKGRGEIQLCTFAELRP